MYNLSLLIKKKVSLKGMNKKNLHYFYISILNAAQSVW